MRKRPPNRLVTTCIKFKDEDSGFEVFLHCDRALEGNKLGRVLQLSLTPKVRSGSGLDTLFAELTRVINQEIQKEEIK